MQRLSSAWLRPRLAGLAEHWNRRGGTGVAILLVRAGRPRHDRRSLGRAGGCQVCAIARSVAQGKRVRADRTIPRYSTCGESTRGRCRWQRPIRSTSGVPGRSLRAGRVSPLEFLVQRRGSGSTGFLPRGARAKAAETVREHRERDQYFALYRFKVADSRIRPIE